MKDFNYYLEMVRETDDEYKKLLLIKLITNNSEVIEKNGYAIIGGGIYDDAGNEYIGGIDNVGTIYGGTVDSDNTILNFDGERTEFKVSSDDETEEQERE